MNRSLAFVSSQNGSLVDLDCEGTGPAFQVIGAASFALRFFRVANCISANGGAIFAQASNVDIADCIFENNTATAPNGFVLLGGGAVFLNRSLWSRFHSNTFSGNRAPQGSGGAILLHYFDPTLAFEGIPAQLTELNHSFVHNHFMENVAGGCGANHVAGLGGAISVAHMFNSITTSHLHIESNSFTENGADPDGTGGAVSLSFWDSLAVNYSAGLVANSFERNRALIGPPAYVGGTGGAVSIMGIEAYLYQCTFTFYQDEFVANLAGTSGGAVQIVYPEIASPHEDNSDSQVRETVHAFLGDRFLRNLVFANGLHLVAVVALSPSTYPAMMSPISMI